MLETTICMENVSNSVIFLKRLAIINTCTGGGGGVELQEYTLLSVTATITGRIHVTL